MITFDLTKRQKDAWDYFDAVHEERISRIAEIAEVQREKIKKLNPAEFIEHNRFEEIRGYHYQKIEEWIKREKTDDTFLVSPADAIEETAAQISYKSDTAVQRTLRASKCEVVPIPKETAMDFFIRNHRQGQPNWRDTSVCFGLVFGSELVAVMHYDISNGAVRGKKKDYELVRLAIAKGTRIHGGASKLQAACEETLRQMGVSTIYSYSNATINTGAVYEKLGFTSAKIEVGQPFVITRNNELIRLIELYPDSTDEALALRRQLKTHISGNKTWTKDIAGGQSDGTENAE